MLPAQRRCWLARLAVDCVAHSYGQVRGFFRAHPCKALFGALFEVRDSRDNIAVLAVAWVDMPDADQRRQPGQLMDRRGTGNIIELSRERGGQRFSGGYYHSARDGTTMVNVQVWADPGHDVGRPTRERRSSRGIRPGRRAGGRGRGRRLSGCGCTGCDDVSWRLAAADAEWLTGGNVVRPRGVGWLSP